MSFTKIVAGDLTGKGIALLPDLPELTGAQMRTVLEEIVRDVAIVKHNSHIDELEASTSAASIGAVDLASSETTVQALLDTINFSGKTAQTSVTNDDTKIPTSGAIVDYVTGLGGGDMQKAIYDTTNSGTVDDSKKLGGVAASSYVSTVDSSLSTISENPVQNKVLGLAIGTGSLSGIGDATIIGAILELAKSLKNTTVTLESDGWTAMSGGFYQTVVASGYLAGEKPRKDLVPATQPFPTTAEETALLLVKNAVCVTNGYVTFYAITVPIVDLTFELRGV